MLDIVSMTWAYRLATLLVLTTACVDGGSGPGAAACHDGQPGLYIVVNNTDHAGIAYDFGIAYANGTVQRLTAPDKPWGPQLEMSFPYAAVAASGPADIWFLAHPDPCTCARANIQVNLTTCTEVHLTLTDGVPDAGVPDAAVIDAR